MIVLSAYPAAIMPVSSLNLAQKHSPWPGVPVVIAGVSFLAAISAGAKAAASRGNGRQTGRFSRRQQGAGIVGSPSSVVIPGARRPTDTMNLPYQGTG
eukprot:SAG31_NODE_743_length_12418_cov_3.780908_9_plen_98_part_00